MRPRSAGRRKGTVALHPLTLASLLLSACASIHSGPALVERRVMLMGTALDVEVEAVDRPAALAASERAVEALEAAEARLSTWREETELARLNRTPVGEPRTLSPALARDLQAARSCWEETGGAFDPGVGALVRAWGLRTGGRIPDLAELRAANGVSGLRLRGGVAVREKELLLEEGGWGKGAGLMDALQALQQSGVARASLDLGGQVAVLGGWEVPVADPRRRDRSVAVLKVDGGSVSTSGNGERRIVVEGKRLGHILDPRTGAPAPDFGSLTVWTADPLRADCLSTGLYVLGPEQALAWAAAHPGVEVLVLLRREGNRLRALASPGLRGRLKAMDPEVKIDFVR
ncbi:MAG: FAD:protein FMN transferase [Thermoanaerobaculia bacterium]